jgi:uncharacterized protein (TIGR02453 family)
MWTDNVNMILEFLRELRKNNNRVYFNENKGSYLAAKGAFEELVGGLIDDVVAFDDGVKYLSPQDCIFRIYRDVRFSPNKQPYKTHFGAYIAPKGGRKSVLGGYYIHLESDNCLLGGGIYCTDSPMLKKLRQGIFDNYGDLMGIVNAPDFKKNLKIVSSESLKKVPAGFPKDFEGVEWLKYKNYQLWHPMSDDEMANPQARERLLDVFKAMKPFNDFFNSILTEDL